MLVKQKNRFITEVPFIITSGKVCRFFSKTIIDRDKRFFCIVVYKNFLRAKIQKMSNFMALEYFPLSSTQSLS